MHTTSKNFSRTYCPLGSWEEGDGSAGKIFATMLLHFMNFDLFPYGLVGRLWAEYLLPSCCICDSL